VEVIDELLKCSVWHNQTIKFGTDLFYSFAENLKFGAKTWKNLLHSSWFYYKICFTATGWNALASQFAV